MAMNAGRSVHGVPKHATQQASQPVLRIDGLVGRERELQPDDLTNLPRQRYLEELHDDAAGNLPPTNWSGIPLSAVIALAAPPQEAKWVRISAGPYATIVSMADADNVLLCDRIDDQPLPVENGGPWRLVRPNVRYFHSVKWVDTITVTAEEPDNSAERIAKARQRARDSRR